MNSRQLRRRALVLSSLFLATLLVPIFPGADASHATSVRVTIYNSGGSVLTSFTNAFTHTHHDRFAVATEGHNDAGSGEGLLAIDNLVILRNDGTSSTLDFSTTPAIRESTTGNTNDALRWDAGGQRLLGVGNSGYACSTNYESVDLGPGGARSIRFTVSRLTGDIGDGSFWNIYAGLLTGDAQPIVSPSCSYTAPTGWVDNLLGVQFLGDGDGYRSAMVPFSDGSSGSGVGMGIGASYSVEISLGPPYFEDAPRNFAVAPTTTPGTVRASWTEPLSAPYTAVTGYRLYRGDTASGPKALVASVGPTVRTYDDAHLSTGTYYYHVKAVTAGGESLPSNEAAGTTVSTFPSAPRSLYLSNGPLSGQVTLTWYAPARGDAPTGYRIYRGTAPGATSFLKEIGPQTTYTDPLVAGVTYSYRVTAKTRIGESAPSNEASIGASTPVIVAFGDSVAAGHGYWKAEGYRSPNSGDSYPYQLTANFDGIGYNFAISGACAATASAHGGTGVAGTSLSCHKSIRDLEFLHLAAESVSPAPAVVTVNIGANDIDFAGCLKAFFEDQPNGTEDPCRPDKLSGHLDAFSVNLDRVLSELKVKFPQSRFVVTQYYNPFPPGDAPVCDMFFPTAAKRARLATENTAEFRETVVRTVQTNAYGHASVILERLNAVIRTSAERAGATTFQVDFSGHDMCARLNNPGKVQWVFGPEYDFVFNKLSARSFQLEYGPEPAACPDKHLDPEDTHTDNAWYERAAVGYELVFKVNCMPHPTKEGHAAIARQIAIALTGAATG